MQKREIGRFPFFVASYSQNMKLFYGFKQLIGTTKTPSVLLYAYFLTPRFSIWINVNTQSHRLEIGDMLENINLFLDYLLDFQSV